MKKQKQYNMEQSIVRDIDAAKVKFGELMAQAERKEAESQIIFKNQFSTPENIKQAQWLKSESEKLRAQATRIETVKLVKLKNALATFRTGTFPTIVQDKQVTL